MIKLIKVVIFVALVAGTFGVIRLSPGPIASVKPLPGAVASFQQSGSNGKSVLDILKQAHSVETVNQGSLGIYVRSIDGIESTKRALWLFYVDGALGEKSADKTVTTPTQIIEWKYEPI